MRMHTHTNTGTHAHTHLLLVIIFISSSLKVIEQQQQLWEDVVLVSNGYGKLVHSNTAKLLSCLLGLVFNCLLLLEPSGVTAFLYTPMPAAFVCVLPCVCVD